jgi:violaxanthin de-epoxidase
MVANTMRLSKLIAISVLGTVKAVEVETNPGVCVLTKCGLGLAECLADSVCRSWQICILGCGDGGPDSLPCQIRCADLYKPTDNTSAKINEFSKCVISENQCVPQQKFTCEPPANTVSQFSLDQMSGEWFVTKGQNPLFDCFDCQVHDFAMRANNAKPLYGSPMKYKVKKDLKCTSTESSSCEYLDREVFQGFSQDPAKQGHLLNHNNTVEELHYADDWYVLAAKADTYALVYYCGCNDASCGYSGSVLYTRSPTFADLSAGDVADIRKAVAAAGVDNFTFDGLCSPNNVACGGKPPVETQMGFQI